MPKPRGDVEISSSFVRIIKTRRFGTSNMFLCSEVCHPRCVFKLYGEVNSVKNTTINIWLNDGVY